MGTDHQSHSFHAVFGVRVDVNSPRFGRGETAQAQEQTRITKGKIRARWSGCSPVLGDWRTHSLPSVEAEGEMSMDNSRNAARPVEPVGGLCPSKKVWETPGELPPPQRFSTPPAGSKGLFAIGAPTSPPTLGTGNAPNPPSDIIG